MTMREISAIDKLMSVLDSERAEYKRLYSMLTAFGDQAPNLFWVKDTNGVYVHCNTPHARWLGADTPEEVVGRTDTYFEKRMPVVAELGHGSFAASSYFSDRATMELGKAGVYLEFVQVKGAFCALRVSKTPWRDSDGTIIGTVGSAVDITERVVLSEALDAKMVKLLDAMHETGVSPEILAAYETVYKDFKALSDRHKYIKRQPHHG